MSIDMRFYYLGYTLGIARKGSKQYKTTLTPTNPIQWTPDRQRSLALGLFVGRKVRKHTGKIKDVVTQVDEPLLSYKDMITVSIGKVFGFRGCEVRVPVVLSHQDKEKYGTKMYQLLLRYNKNGLKLNRVEPSSNWDGTFGYDDTTEGQVVVQCSRTSVKKDNTVMCTLVFEVKDTYDYKLSIDIVGSPGTGQGTELLVQKEDGDLYYITPVNYENGCVVLDEKPTKPTKVGETITIPTDGAAYLGDGGANVSFSFDCSLGFPSGYTPKGNCYICIYAYLNGVIVGQIRIPLTIGDNSYEGDFDLDNLGDLDVGELDFRVETQVEDEEDGKFAYVYIKAGMLIVMTTKLTKKDLESMYIVNPMLNTLKTEMNICSSSVFIIEKVKKDIDLTVLKTSASVESKSVFILKERQRPLEVLKTSASVESKSVFILEEPPRPLDLTVLKTSASVESESVFILKERQRPLEVLKTSASVESKSVFIIT